jgi:hypothetical protein
MTCRRISEGYLRGILALPFPPTLQNPTLRNPVQIRALHSTRGGSITSASWSKGGCDFGSRLDLRGCLYVLFSPNLVIPIRRQGATHDAILERSPRWLPRSQYGANATCLVGLLAVLILTVSPTSAPPPTGFQASLVVGQGLNGPTGFRDPPMANLHRGAVRERSRSTRTASFSRLPSPTSR